MHIYVRYMFNAYIYYNASSFLLYSPVRHLAHFLYFAFLFYFVINKFIKFSEYKSIFPDFSH